MTTYYFPGCKYTLHNPTSSKKLQHYLLSRFDVTIVGCCSMDYQKPKDGDVAIYVCPTCAAILKESAPDAKLISIYEFLLKDSQYIWPSFSGETMTMQDCWRSSEFLEMLQALRQVCQKMDLHILEIRENYDASKYCGVTTYQTPSPRYQKLAPRRLVKEWHFKEASPEVQKEAMLKHAKQYQTEKVIGYCTGCLTGITMGGHTAVHLLDLVTTTI